MFINLLWPTDASTCLRATPFAFFVNPSFSRPLAMAPEAEGGFFVVPPVVEGPG